MRVLRWSGAVLSEEALAEWRAHPVSGAIREAFRAYHRRQIDQCKEAAWAGNPWPEADRLALRREIAALEDMFEADAADFVAMMEQTG